MHSHTDSDNRSQQLTQSITVPDGYPWRDPIKKNGKKPYLHSFRFNSGRGSSGWYSLHSPRISSSGDKPTNKTWSSQSRRRECLSEGGSVRGDGVGPPPSPLTRAWAEQRQRAAGQCVCEAESELEYVSMFQIQWIKIIWIWPLFLFLFNSAKSSSGWCSLHSPRISSSGPSLRPCTPWCSHVRATASLASVSYYIYRIYICMYACIYTYIYLYIYMYVCVCVYSGSSLRPCTPWCSRARATAWLASVSCYIYIYVYI